MVSSTENRVTLVDLGVTQKYSIKGEENIGVRKYKLSDTSWL